LHDAYTTLRAQTFFSPPVSSLTKAIFNTTLRIKPRLPKNRHKRSLGFTDVLATEDPHQRTVKFFSTSLPNIVEPMAAKWQLNKAVLVEYAQGNINLAQLYNVIESPAAGNWQDFE
jgi:hypothetical protein